MKPSKVPIIASLAAMAFSAIATVVEFLRDYPLGGWLWAFATVCWTTAAVSAYRLYRTRQRIHRYEQRILRRLL